MDRLGTWEGHVAALVTSHMNGLEPLERTKEQTTETITPSSKTITAAAMTTNRITSLRELLHYRYKRICNHPFQGRKSIAELPPALNLLVPICTPEWREAGTVTTKCLAQEGTNLHGQSSNPDRSIRSTAH